MNCDYDSTLRLPVHLANCLDSFITLSHLSERKSCSIADLACHCWNNMKLGLKHQFILTKIGIIKQVDLEEA